MVSTNNPTGTDVGSASSNGDTSERVADSAQEQGRELAGSAAEEARSVSHTAQEQAMKVKDDAVSQAQGLLSSATSTLEDKAEEQTHKLADVLRHKSEQATALAEGRTEDAGDIDGYARGVADTLGNIAERIDRLGVRGSIEELQSFARRQPGVFLAAAGATGFLASRLLRNSGGSDDDRHATSGPYGAPRASRPGDADLEGGPGGGHGEHSRMGGGREAALPQDTPDFAPGTGPAGQPRPVQEQHASMGNPSSPSGGR